MLFRNWGRPPQTGNISRVLSDSTEEKTALLLNNLAVLPTVRLMKHSLSKLALSAVFVMSAQYASAACFADYKAKQDNPLRLHYGVAEVSKCSKKTAKTELSKRLASKGWTILNVMSVFDESGLAERKDSAGSNYLRY
ncbi:MAG: hypothetical protein ABJE99_16235 [Roseobacter sp.]